MVRSHSDSDCKYANVFLRKPETTSLLHKAAGEGLRVMSTMINYSSTISQAPHRCRINPQHSAEPDARMWLKYNKDPLTQSSS